MKRTLILLLFPLVLFAQASPATFYYVITAVDANGLESSPSPQTSATLKQGMTKGVTLTWTNNAPTLTGQLPPSVNNIYRSATSGGCAVTSASTCTKVGSVTVGSGSLTFVDPFVAPPAPSGPTQTVS